MSMKNIGWTLLVAAFIVGAVLAVDNVRSLPIVATTYDGTVVAVDYGGKTYASFEEAGVNPNSRYHHIYVKRK